MFKRIAEAAVSRAAKDDSGPAVDLIKILLLLYLRGMTKKFFYCLIVFVLFFQICPGQQKNYFSIAFGKDWPNNHHVIGGYFTGNQKISTDGLYAGVGTAFLKFDNTPNFFFPVFANISYLGIKPDKKLFPVMLIQPGYGFYHHEDAGIVTKGGLTFHSSFGIGYPFLFHKRAYATLGYTHCTFITQDVKTFRNSVGGRLAIIL